MTRLEIAAILMSGKSPPGRHEGDARGEFIRGHIQLAHELMLADEAFTKHLAMEKLKADFPIGCRVNSYRSLPGPEHKGVFPIAGKVTGHPTEFTVSVEWPGTGTEPCDLYADGLRRVDK